MPEIAVKYREPFGGHRLAPEGFVKVKTAVMSVSDKGGLAEFAKVLEAYGVDMLATGGTFTELKAAGLKVRSLQEDMKLPTYVSGRVKTLHAPLHAGILARGTEKDMAELRAMGVGPVGMVVCNFYPFREAVAKGVKDDAELVELAVRNALAIGAGHSFIVFLPEGYPGNVLNQVKQVPEGCRNQCATASSEIG